MTKTVIHETAVISPQAQIGEGCHIGMNVHVRENACIGEGTKLSSGVYVDHGVSLGKACQVEDGVSLYHGVTVENSVFIGPHATFTNDLLPRAANAEWKITPTLVQEGASIGANATILCGVTIGTHAVVAAGSVVTKDVAPHMLVMGNPARAVRRTDAAS